MRVCLKTKHTSILLIPMFMHRDRRTQVLASNVLLHHDTSAWITRPAPPIEDVRWSVIRLRQWERMWRSMVAYCLYIIVAFTYVIPVNALQVSTHGDQDCWRLSC